MCPWLPSVSNASSAASPNKCGLKQLVTLQSFISTATRSRSDSFHFCPHGEEPVHKSLERGGGPFFALWLLENHLPEGSKGYGMSELVKRSSCPVLPVDKDLVGGGLQRGRFQNLKRTFYYQMGASRGPRWKPRSQGCTRRSGF